jgi:hypothetical protein
MDGYPMRHFYLSGTSQSPRQQDSAPSAAKAMMNVFWLTTRRFFGPSWMSFAYADHFLKIASLSFALFSSNLLSMCSARTKKY